jgi:hypothetical protein
VKLIADPTERSALSEFVQQIDLQNYFHGNEALEGVASELIYTVYQSHAQIQESGLRVLTKETIDELRLSGSRVAKEVV